MKNLKIGDVILTVVVLVAAVGLYFYFQTANSNGTPEQVVIEVDGQVVKTFDLPQEKPIEYKVEIEDDEYNLIRIEGSKVRVVEATCPNQDDVKMGWIDRPGETLICLPHKMVVKLTGTDENQDDVDVKTY